MSVKAPASEQKAPAAHAADSAYALWPTVPAGDERLQLVIEAVPTAMLMVDRRGVIALVNSQTEELFGYARQALIGQPIEMLVPDRFRHAHEHYRNSFLQRPATRAMGVGRGLYGLRQDGSEVPIEIGLKPVETADGMHVLASIIDLTERKRAEERLRLVIEAAPNAMLMVNARGAITLVNSQTERLFGYGREELLGKTIETLIPERFRGHHEQFRSGFFAHPDTRAMGAGRDLFGLRKDGSEVPIEIGLNPLRTEDGNFVLASVIDITGRLNAERMLRAAQANLLRQSILDSLPFSVIAINVDGLIITANPAAERLLGYGRHELVGMPTVLVHDASELKQRATELSAKEGRTIAPNFQVIVTSGSREVVDEREWTYVRKDGSRVPVNVAITALRDEQNQVTGFLKVAYDITERKRVEDYIRHMAHHDALTNLPNRSLLLDRLQMAIRNAQRQNNKVAVLLLDVDHFKRVNDSLGHMVGDKLLLAVAARLQQSVRDVDTVARLGGDEFVVVLTNVGSRIALATVIEDITRTLGTPLQIDDHELLFTASIGGCLFPDDSSDANELLKYADTAMYCAKAIGRSNFQWFNATMREQAEDRLALSGALRRAIDDNRLSVHYQPEVSLDGRRVVGIEALVRWDDGVRGMIPPDRFIPVAEESGLILQLGEWVLRTACRECAQLNRDAAQPLILAVNVSPRQFQHGDLPKVVREALAQSGLQASCLEIEITEGILMHNPEESAQLLRELRRLGVRIVIDDFGTGYSSLSYVSRFPIDKIKIDRSFIRDLATDSADAAIVNAIIAMAHSLDVCVVAEGVENQQQLDYLRRRGCDQAQGFLFSKAVIAGELARAISDIEMRCSDLLQS